MKKGRATNARPFLLQKGIEKQDDRVLVFFYHNLLSNDRYKASWDLAVF
jgi:hypothetical protein